MHPFGRVCLPLLLALIAALRAAPAQTRNLVGFSTGISSATVSRLGPNNFAVDALQHFDDRDLRDWMLDRSNPAGTTLLPAALVFWIQDQDGATVDAFDLVGYGPDPAQPDFPSPAGPWFRTGAIQLPPTPLSGPVAFSMTITLAVPPHPTGDVWLGCGLPPSPVRSWPADGMGVQITQIAKATIGRGAQGMSLSDLCCFVPTSGGVPTGAATYPVSSNLTQLRMDVLADATAGLACTQRNVGGLLTLTTSLAAAANPDTINATGSTPPRADPVGFLVEDHNFPNAPVVLLQAFGPLPGGPVPAISVPLAAQLGTTGNVCIDIASANLTFLVTDAGGRCLHLVPMTAALSAQIALLPPFDVWWQAFVVNVAAGTAPLELHGTGCAIQHL